MKKLFLVLFFLGIGSLLAQITIPTTVEIDYPGGPGLQMGYTPEGYTAMKLQKALGFAKYITRTVSPDSMQNQKWTLTVERILSLNPCVYVINIDGFLLVAPSERLTYRDTVDVSTSSGYLAVPDRDSRATPGGSPFPFSQDSLWQVYWNLDSKLRSGATTDWIFTHIRPIVVDSAGRLATQAIDYRAQVQKTEWQLPGVLAP